MRNRSEGERSFRNLSSNISNQKGILLYLQKYYGKTIQRYTKESASAHMVFFFFFPNIPSTFQSGPQSDPTLLHHPTLSTITQCHSNLFCFHTVNQRVKDRCEEKENFGHLDMGERALWIRAKAISGTQKMRTVTIWESHECLKLSFPGSNAQNYL